MSHVMKFRYFVLLAFAWLITIFFGNVVVAAPPTNGLIGLFEFTGNANNSVPNRPNGVAVGPQLTEDRFGNPNSAYLFDGVDDFIDVPNTGGVYSLAAPFTIAAWARPSAPGVDPRSDPIIWKIRTINSNSDNYLLTWSTDSVFMAGFENAANGADSAVFSNVKQFGRWYHVAGVYNGQVLAIYVNGALENSVQVGPASPYAGPAPLRIGNLLHSDHTRKGVFNGAIDEVAIYNRALAPAEIVALAGEIPPPSAVGNAVGVGLFNASRSAFSLKQELAAGPADVSFRFGPPGAGWSALVGDWNGNGIETVGLYNPNNGTFYFKNALTTGIADAQSQFGPGGAGWIPLAGNWNGDNTDAIGVYNPNTGVFHLKNTIAEGPAEAIFQFGPGGAGWIPLAGDWDGNGIETVGLYNPNAGRFYFRNALTPGVADVDVRYGPAGAGWVPIVGDWDGDGVDTMGLYNPSDDRFHLRNTLTSGAADLVFQFAPPSGTWSPLVGAWNITPRAPSPGTPNPESPNPGGSPPPPQP